MTVSLLASLTETLNRIGTQDLFGDRALATETHTKCPLLQPAKCVAQFIELRVALECEHGVYLVKPNLGELAALVGAPLPDQASRIAACRRLIAAGQAEAVALTLGADGALLVTGDGAWRAAAPPIEAVSAVGAGDSFLGGMAWALASGRPLDEAFKYGMAAGSAAVLSPGTELCHADDVWRLAEKVVVEPLEGAPARKTVSSAT